MTKPDTLINQPMHEAQIEKLEKGNDVFMVLNRGGGKNDDEMDKEEWTKREEDFFIDMVKKYPMYEK